MPPWGWVFSLSFWLEFSAWVLVFSAAGVKKKSLCTCTFQTKHCACLIVQTERKMQWCPAISNSWRVFVLCISNQYFHDVGFSIGCCQVHDWKTVRSTGILVFCVIFRSCRFSQQPTTDELQAFGGWKKYPHATGPQKSLKMNLPKIRRKLCIKRRN